MNQLPALAAYLKEPREGWKEWQNLEMKWIPHANPELVILDEDGKDKERIALGNFDDNHMARLLNQKGFEKR